MRRFGQELNQNRRRNAELTVQQRDSIISKAEAGASTRELSEEFNCTMRCIQKTIARFNATATNVSRPRSGRPPKLTTREKKMLHRVARKSPKIQYRSLLYEAHSMHVSRRTATRLLHVQGLGKFRAKRKPRISPAVAEERLKFEREYRDFDWRHQPFRFSDETSVTKSIDGNNVWVFRLPHEKWRQEMIDETTSGRKRALMCWGSVWIDRRRRIRRSPLILMNRDSESRRNGYTSRSYIDALERGLLPNYRDRDIFMQDNAPIHTSATTRRFLRRCRIRVVSFPRYSPDLNPIEHLWYHLKRILQRDYPTIDQLPDTEDGWAEFGEALKTSWRRIPDSYIRQLIFGIPKRLNAVRLARGYQTKY